MVRAGQTVLDVTCGQGNVAMAAARRFADATGVDYAANLLAQGRERAAAEHLPVTFLEDDAECCWSPGVARSASCRPSRPLHRGVGAAGARLLQVHCGLCLERRPSRCLHARRDRGGFPCPSRCLAEAAGGARSSIPERCPHGAVGSEPARAISLVWLEPLTTAFSALSHHLFPLLLEALAEQGICLNRHANRHHSLALVRVESHGLNHGFERMRRLVANSGQHGHGRSHQPWRRSRLAHRGRYRPLRLLHFAAALHQQGMSFSILCSLGFVGLHLSLTAVLLGGSETCRTAVNCNYRCNPKTTRRR
jgi:hypothetical protein